MQTTSLQWARRRPGLALLITLVAATAGCSGGYLDHSFRTGHHADVVREFEADTAHQRGESDLYHAGLSYAAAAPPVHSPGRARAVLEELVSRYPESDYRSVADPMLVLLRELEWRTAQAEAAQAGADSVRADLEQAQRELTASRARAEQLHGELRERDQRIQALERQIAELKRIDLRR